MIREIIEGEKKDKIKKNKNQTVKKFIQPISSNLLPIVMVVFLRNSVKLITGLSSTRNTIFFFPCFLLDDTYKHNKIFHSVMIKSCKQCFLQSMNTISSDRLTCEREYR